MANGNQRFNVQYPPRNYIGLDGGLNNNNPKQWILENESSDCLNVTYGVGSVETRKGSIKVNSSAVATFACDGLYTRHVSTGAETMTAWFGGTLYYLSGTSAFVPVASGTSALTAGIRVGAAEYEDYIFYGNGQSIAYKYNGEFTRHGIYAPTSTFSVATHASGYSLATGSYYFKMTNVNSNLVESDVGPVSAVYTASGSTGVYFTSLPVAAQSYGVSTRRLYYSNDGTNYYRAGDISNNTATTYVLTGTTAAALAAPTDQGVPPKYQVCLTHQARLFVISTEDNFVWYSEIANPYVFKATNFRRIGDDTGEIPTALGIWDNYLMVFCKSGQAWAVYMPDNDDSNWIDFKIRSAYGCKSPFAIFPAINQLIFPAMQNGKFVGFAAITAAGLDPQANLTTVGAQGSELLSKNIQPTIDLINTSYLGNISSIVYENKAYISFTYSSATTNDRIFVFDFEPENLTKKQKYTWSLWSGLNIAQFCVYDGSLYGASADTTGIIYKLNQSVYSDGYVSEGSPGTAIDSYVKTKEFYGLDGHEVWYKDWRFVNILYELSGDWFMGLTTWIDSDSGVGVVEDIDLQPATALWGGFSWAQGNWEAGRSEFDLKKSLGRFRGKRIRFMFSNKNTVGAKFKVLGLSFKYNLKGLR